MINAKTRLIGLFGHPVEHSFSPVFMNHALELLNINARYMAFDLAPILLKSGVESARTLNMVGFNITIPHKQKIIKFLDLLDKNAERIGAVNCVLNTRGKLLGYNTDWIGFLEPLDERNITLAGKPVLLIGAGGAARAVAYALIKKNPSRVMVVNRTREKAESFIRWLKGESEEISIPSGKILISYGGKPENLNQKLVDESYMIVNTTPVGMYPEVNSSPLPIDLKFSKTQIVYDLIYNPAETLLLKNAGECGSTTLNGFEMLISQGLYSLKIWFPNMEGTISSKKRAILKHAEKLFYQKS